MVSWLGSDVKFFRRKLYVFVIEDTIGQGGGMVLADMPT